jgi:hypothetical protein
MADCTRLRIIAVMHYALCVWMLRALLMIRKITVGRQVYAPFTVCFSLHERVRLWKRVRVFLSTRERVNSSAKALRSTRLSRRRRIIFLSPRCALFRRAHRRVHHRSSLRFDAPGDSISVIAVVLEINRKQWGLHACVNCYNVSSRIFRYLRNSELSAEVSRSYRAFLQLWNIIFC